MKVICILQNAWGDGDLPLVFSPNPRNKSARTIRDKVLRPDDIMHFCNTTGQVATNAAGRFAIDSAHFGKVLKRLHSCALILVCGKQAKAACDTHGVYLAILQKPIVYMPHPASRVLSNLELALVRVLVDKHRK